MEVLETWNKAIEMDKWAVSVSLSHILSFVNQVLLHNLLFTFLQLLKVAIHRVHLPEDLLSEESKLACHVLVLFREHLLDLTTALLDEIDRFVHDHSFDVLDVDVMRSLHLLLLLVYLELNDLQHLLRIIE